MRADLAAAVGGVLATVTPALAVLTNKVSEEILDAAELVTFARTAVNRDYQGNVTDAEAPEMPTRLAKMLGQVVRGGLSLGMGADHALALARRTAHDSMPPLRLLVLADVMDHPGATTTEVTKRVQRPRATVDRTLQKLHLLELLEVDDNPGAGRGWRYRLSMLVKPSVLALLITRNVSTGGYGDKEEPVSEHLVADIPGDRPDGPGPPARCWTCDTQLTPERAGQYVYCEACWDWLIAAQPDGRAVS